MKQAIENIGKKVLDFIFDFDKNEYEYEGACCEPENNLYEGASVSVSGCIKEYGHYITISADSNGSVEILFEDDEYPCLEKAVNDYVEQNLDTDEMLSQAEDNVRENSMNEFQRNGFRDAADYYHYRFG